MKTNNILKKIGLGLAISALAACQASAIVSYNAFDTPNTTLGNQVWNNGTGGNLAQEFTPNQNILVTALGAFDSGLDGFGAANITVAIYNSVGTTLASQTFTGTTTGTAGTLGNAADGNSSAYRFLSVSPITLYAGQTYAIVASGLGSTLNPDYNSGGGATLITANTGGGLLSFGNDYYSTLGGPVYPNGGMALGGSQAGLYGAGTFNFTSLTPVPEVDTFAIAAVSMLGLVFIGRNLAPRRRF